MEEDVFSHRSHRFHRDDRDFEISVNLCDLWENYLRYEEVETNPWRSGFNWKKRGRKKMASERRIKELEEKQLKKQKPTGTLEGLDEENDDAFTGTPLRDCRW